MGTPFDLPAGATLGSDGAYRYFLWRTWAPEADRMLFVMLNPSTADETKDDATIRKCVGFAERNDCGGIGVINLFAHRSRNPKELLEVEDPFGPALYEQIKVCAEGLRPRWVVMAWGEVARPVLKKMYACDTDPIANMLLALPWLGTRVSLGRGATGQPLHPLMLGYDRPLIPWHYSL